jgi:NAD(P)-dependent dehydrogenase (short-subunit alcohol dehydrogenase family)
VEAAARAVADSAGRLDVLVNNAAYVDWGETATGADLAASRAVMDTNLYGTWHVIQAFLPLLRRSLHPVSVPE